MEVRYTPPQKGYLSDTCAIPYESKAKRVRYPPLRYYLERVLHDMGGGILHWAAKVGDQGSFCRASADDPKSKSLRPLARWDPSFPVESANPPAPKIPWKTTQNLQFGSPRACPENYRKNTKKMTKVLRFQF